VCAVCLLLAPSAGPALGSQEETLTIGISNPSHVPPEILQLAMAEGRGIFEVAGIATEWVDMSVQPDAPVAVYIRILPGNSRNLGAPDALGNAYLSRTERSNLADVSYGRVAENAWTNPNVARLLASVMAHEVGHILLGAEHSRDGLMHDHWGAIEFHLAQAGALLFTARQAEGLRTGVLAILAVPGPRRPVLALSTR
jgi:hypothetical protein